MRGGYLGNVLKGGSLLTRPVLLCPVFSARSFDVVFFGGIHAAAVSPGDPGQEHTCLSAHQISLQSLSRSLSGTLLLRFALILKASPFIHLAWSIPFLPRKLLE